MASFSAVFVLLICFNFISGYEIIGDDADEIIWPNVYHFSGEKLDFITTLKGPFELWYSGELNRSRVDFYGGTNKKYFYGDLGIVYTMIPTTDLNLVSEMACLSKSTKDEHMDFMPDVSGFTRSGQSISLFDKQVDAWTSEDVYKEIMIKRQTLYIHRTEYGFDIPVQHVVQIFYIDTGKVAGHYAMNFYNFNDSVTEDDLEMKAAFCMVSGELGQDFKTDIQVLHPDLPKEVDIAFDSYTRHHSKKYEEDEKKMRQLVFEQNWRMVHEHNRHNLSFKLELNQFSDKTDEELSYLTATYIPKQPVRATHDFPHTLSEVDEIVETLPEVLDLRIDGFITSVKNQGACGSCWAFATTAAIEGAVAKANGDRLLDLSEQSLVDCGWNYETNGCHGGALDGALKYVFENGIPTEEDYGVYTEHDGFCQILNMTDVYRLKGFAKVTPRNPNALKVALNKYGPVTVAIHAGKLMKHYSSGIFYDFSCEKARINHGVTVVGYGTRNGEEYWLVKNSWGESWGEDGYILMSAKNNNCFLLDWPYYPIV